MGREKMRSVNGKRGGEWLARGENGRVTHFLQQRGGQGGEGGIE